MSGRSVRRKRTSLSESAGGNRTTVRSPRGANAARKVCTTAAPALGPWFIFQFAANTGLTGTALLVVENGDARQRLALEELERRTAAGGNVAHFRCESGLFHRRRRIAATHDGRRTLAGCGCHGVRDGAPALAERWGLEPAHGPIPQDRPHARDGAPLAPRRP